MKNRLNIWIMYAIALLQGMVFYGPVATLYRQSRGVSLFQITIIESISLILVIFLEIPWGTVADKIGYKKTMIICNVLYFVSKIVFWKASGFGWFLAERVILSVVLAGLSGCDSAYLFLASGGDKSRKVFGIYSAMGTAGLIAASIVYSMFIIGDYPLSGFLTVVSYGISMLLTFFLGEIKPAEKVQHDFAKNLGKVIRAFRDDKRFLLFLLSAVMLLESNQTLTVFFSQVQYVRTGIPQKYIGYIYSAVTVSGLLSVFAHRLTDWAGDRRACTLLFVSGFAACAVLAFTEAPVISVLCIILLRISASLFTPISMEIQNRQVKIPERAAMLSVYSSIMSIGGAFTNIAFGRLGELNIGLAFGMGALLCLTGLVMYTAWMRNRMKNSRAALSVKEN